MNKGCIKPPCITKLENEYKMNKTEIFENKLSIIITTYNRSSYFEETLKSIAVSPLACCSITILNNCSSDETLNVAEHYRSCFPTYKVVTHPFNIGGNANILRSIEYADKEYMWICHDDDKFDFSELDDLADTLERGEVDLIQIGAHADNQWSNYGGTLSGAKELLRSGYHYFKYSSFTPCNIFRKDAFSPFVIAGYNNIANSYTIMPFLLSLYTNNKKIYLTKKQIVFAQVGNQSYNNDDLIKWWYYTSQILSQKTDRRNCFWDQFSGYNRFSFGYNNLIRCDFMAFRYCWLMYTWVERLLMLGYAPIYIIKKCVNKIFYLTNR